MKRGRKSNPVTIWSTYEVQEFAGGWAVFLVTYEQTEKRSGDVKIDIKSNKKLSPVWGDKNYATRRMPEFRLEQ